MNTQQSPSFNTLPNSLKGGRMSFVRSGGYFIMETIALTKGMITIVDDEDYKRLKRYKWYYKQSGNMGYAFTTYRNRPKSMASIIMRCYKKGFIVDHIDRNSLNNQRENLRICTQLENTCNRPSQESTTSKYKGVSRHSTKSGWVAQIVHKYKYIYLGLYRNEENAAIAYDQAAIQLHGEFAYLNYL